MIMYELVTEWFFGQPIEAVWQEIENLQDWPSWWAEWKQLDVHGEGEQQVGTTMDCAVRGSLPYTLRFQLEITKIEAPTLNEHKSTGDLEGTGRWVLEERDGGTAVTHYWNVGTTSALFNFLGRFSFVKSLMEDNHTAMMAHGYAGLQQRLQAA